jgi:hypothetical protein
LFVVKVWTKLGLIGDAHVGEILEIVIGKGELIMLKAYNA